MATLSTSTNIRICCEKGRRTLVLDAEDVREVINCLIRQNMVEFSIENLPDYRKDKSPGSLRGVPYEDITCHASYAMTTKTDAGAEIISVTVDVSSDFMDASYHDDRPSTEELYAAISQTPDSCPDQLTRDGRRLEVAAAYINAICVLRRAKDALIEMYEEVYSDDDSDNAVTETIDAVIDTIGKYETMFSTEGSN